MSNDAKFSMQHYLVHLATDPELQEIVSSLNGEDLNGFLTASGLGEADAQMLVKARANKEGTKALVDNMNVGARGWTYNGYFRPE